MSQADLKLRISTSIDGSRRDETELELDAGVPIDDSLMVVKNISGSVVPADPIPCPRTLPDNVFVTQIGDIWVILSRQFGQNEFSTLNL